MSDIEVYSVLVSRIEYSDGTGWNSLLYKSYIEKLN